MKSDADNIIPTLGKFPGIGNIEMASVEVPMEILDLVTNLSDEIPAQINFSMTCKAAWAWYTGTKLVVRTKGFAGVLSLLLY